jgi:hypothetical protein
MSEEELSEITLYTDGMCKGKHKMIINHICQICDDGDIDPDCDYCGGQHEFEVAYVIPWQLQKDIYLDMLKVRLQEINSDKYLAEQENEK